MPRRPAAVRRRAQALFDCERAGTAWAAMLEGLRRLAGEPDWQGPALADCERVGEIIEMMAQALRPEAAGRLWPGRVGGYRERFFTGYKKPARPVNR